MKTKSSNRIAIALVIALTAIVALVALTTGQRSSIPACETEDGSTQQVCIWDDGSGDKIINLDWGHWSYNVDNHELTEY